MSLFNNRTVKERDELTYYGNNKFTRTFTGACICTCISQHHVPVALNSLFRKIPIERFGLLLAGRLDLEDVDLDLNVCV